MRSNFLQQFLAVVPNKQHFFFGEWPIDGNASKQVFARFSESLYVVLDLHRSKEIVAPYATSDKASIGGRRYQPFEGF